jgi:amidase
MDLNWIDATDAAELLRRKEVTSLELVTASLSRMEEVNPTLNCVVERLDERALEAARHPRGDGSRFDGVPFLVKETAELAGTGWTAASYLTKDRRCATDSELMRRYLASGLVPIGKTNLPEFGILGTTEPRFFGPTRNPWDLSRSPGGSSGGSAAAVAAGVVPMAHGSDAGGSIRIPASCCGVVGLKPSRHRNPTAPGSNPAGLTGEHVLTRSVRDCAAALDATAGPYAGRGRFSAETLTFEEAAQNDPGDLRLGFSTRSPLGFAVTGQCAEAVIEAARTCETLGHHVDEVAPAFGDGLFAAFDVIWTSQLAASVARALGALKEPPENSVEPLTRAIWELGRNRSANEYIQALAEVDRAFAIAAAFHESYDLWLTPTVASPPPRLGWFEQPPEDPLLAYRRDAEFCAFTPVANMTGQPAISLPLCWTDDGLPIGIQVTGAVGAEIVLIGLAGQLERARPWRRRPPGLSR